MERTPGNTAKIARVRRPILGRTGFFVAAVLLGAILVASWPASAHPAPPAPQNYLRQLADCVDDWSGHSSIKDGHDLIALDVTERHLPSANADVVALFLTVAGGFASQGSAGGPLKETFTFQTPTGTVRTQVQTMDNKAFTVVSGSGTTDPVLMRQPQPVNATGTSAQDGTRFSVELDYTYAQLGVKVGDKLHHFKVLGFAKEKKADYLAGGVYDYTTGTEVYLSNCPQNGTSGEVYYDSGAAGYTLRGVASIYFDGALDTSKVAVDPDVSVNKTLTLGNKFKFSAKTPPIKRTDQNVTVAAMGPPGWTVNVTPSASFLLGDGASAKVTLGIRATADASDGAINIRVSSLEGGWLEFAIPVQLNAPAPANDTTEPPPTTTSHVKSGVPGFETAMLAGALLVALIRRRP